MGRDYVPKVKVYVTIFVSLLAISLGLSVKAGAAEDLAVTKTSIVLESYEFGPAVTKVIFEFNQKVTPEVVHSSTQVTTAGVSRQVTNSYVSDDQGHVVYYDNSKYVTLELSLPSYNRYNMVGMLNLCILTFLLGPINGWKVIWYQ
ncbi:MAG: hypothetical protein ACLS5G_02640 [Streptococcus sp.]